MKRLAATVGILALAATMPQGFAQNATQTEPAATAAPAQLVELPPKVKALLEDKRPLAELSPRDLQIREQVGNKFAAMEGLSPEVKAQLKEMASAAQAELAKRQNAEAPAAPVAKAEPAPKVAAAEAPVVVEPPKVAVPKIVEAPKVEMPKVEVPKVAQATEPPKVEPAKPAAIALAPSALPPEVQALLADSRPLESLTVDELKNRFRMANRFSKDPALPPEVRQQLKEIATASRQAAMQAETQQQPVPQPKAAVPVAPPPAKVEATPVVPAQPKATEVVPVTPPAKVVEAVPAAPPAPGAPPVVTPPAGTVVQKAVDPTPVPAPVVDAGAEQKAQAYLNDKTDVSKLSDDQLRARVEGIRELLANNDTSVEIERAVRKKLRGESDLLRQRVAQAEAVKQAEAAKQAAAQQPAQPPVAGQPPKPGQPPVAGQPPKPGQSQAGNNNNGNAGAFIAGAAAGAALITMLTPYDQVLQDRRPARDLQVEELQRRVQAYDYAYNNPGFADGSRADWQTRARADRALLRARMKEERRRREAELAMQAAQGSYDVEIPNVPPPRRRPRSYVAAEVGNDQLEEVLTSRASGNFQKRYQVNDIANQPQLRDSIQRIDVDTIHFGYNESFVREEELGNLDAIAEIMERIVRKYPNEVFLIEGHTDAPGSAAYNLALSKKRAESVKAALTAYYVIPAKNLRTAGLGARFLKIPTADPEPENRRVSIARITDLLGAN